MDRRILVAAGVAAAIAAAAAVLGGAPTPGQESLGIGLVINSPDALVSIQQLGAIYAQAASTGIDRTNAYMFWNVVEPEQGSFDWSQSDVVMELAGRYGLDVTLFFSVVNGPILGPFPQWASDGQLSGVDPEYLADTLDAVLTRYDVVDVVLLGGETEAIYLYNEEDAAVYRNLFLETYEIIKERHPDVSFGNSFGLHHILNRDLERAVEDLALGDVIGFSYFPVDRLNDIGRVPEEAGADLAASLDLAQGMRVGFFEVGWGTSEFVGGSEESQSRFVGVVFDFYDQNRPEIEFLTWYRQYDRPEGTCATLEQQIGSRSVTVDGDSGLATNEFVLERLDKYLCSSGLLQINGTPKPAWGEFVAQMGLAGR